MDATVRFYHGVLGARLVATIGTQQFRHYFFEFGDQNTVAFFEYSGVDVGSFAKSAGIPDPRAPQFDHLSFNLPDEEGLLSLRDSLKTAGCEVTDVVDHGFIRSIYFHDPNGIRLEITTPLEADWNDRPEVAHDIVGAWLDAKREAHISGRPTEEVLRQVIASREAHGSANDIPD